MAISTSGPVSASTINTELGRASSSNLSIDAAENGSYGAINQNSATRPSSSNPASYSEWRGYNHSAQPAQLPAPQNLQKTSSTNTSITFTHSSVSGASSYRVFFDSVLKSNYTNPPNTVSALNTNTEYAVMVRAVNSAGVDGLDSNIVYMSTSVSCFVKGTMITLPGGSTSPIELLYLNQILLSARIETLADTNDVNELYKWNSNYIKTTSQNSSIASIVPVEVYNTIIINNGLLEATPSHSQLIQRNGIWKFIPLIDIQLNDMLYDIEGNIIEVSSIDYNIEKRTVYKMTLVNPHTYYANNILTHNVKFA
jgi:hypothetical protein